VKEPRKRVQYDPQFCEDVFTFQCAGKSLLAFGAHIHVSMKTLRKWMEEHEEFAEACETGRLAAVRFWEGELYRLSQIGGPTQAAVFALKNHGREYYTESANDAVKVNVNVSPKETLIQSIDEKFARIIDHRTEEKVSGSTERGRA
jgi:hypothetical protein